MSAVLSCFKNLLETSTVSLAAGTADSTYPLYRLYDRVIGKMFKTTAAVTTEVQVDQGASGNLAADRLLIPAGHNLSGMTLDILYSDNGSAWSTAVTQWVQADNNLIDKSWASITHRYWKFKITSPASIPQIPEIFLTQTYTWERNPSLPLGPIDDVFNVENVVTSGGQDRFLTHGSAKRQRQYKCTGASETQRASITLLNAAWAGGKPFWLYDHEGTAIYGKLKEPLNLIQTGENNTGGLFSFDINFLEVLP